MRLTLRTLLAYLDDQLEPGEIKQIGQKVAESDAAQELIARIKQVTRRRRLTTPPDGGPNERFDANVVAAYLDNELTGEQIAEIEKICLESDVHLAEISACHQILTLVLGEPALVPPTAKRRMYGLVHGKGKAVRKSAPEAPAAAAAAAAAAPHEEEDSLLLGLPIFRKAPWLRWALPLAAVVLLSGLAVLLLSNLSGGGGPAVVSRKNADDNGKDTKDNAPDPNKDRKDNKDNAPDPNKDRKDNKDNTSDANKDKTKVTDPGGVKIPPPPGKANMERVEAGRFTSPAGVVLVRKPKDKSDWERVGARTVVHTGEPLVSLPGYVSELALASNVNLTLWGNLPEFLPAQILESAVTLHHDPQVDLDFTLQRGRVYVSNRKSPATVRLRFGRDEVWDFTLEEADTLLVAELWSYYPPGLYGQDGEEPATHLVTHFVRGKGSAKIGYVTHRNLGAPPGQAMFHWVNKRGLEGPSFVEKEIPPLRPGQEVPPKARPFRAALDELARELVDPQKRLDIALMESLDSSEPERRLLGVRCLGAIDAVDTLLGVMAREDADTRTYFDVRQEAIFALRNFLWRGPGQAAKLHDPKTGAGALTERKFRSEDAEVVVHLLAGIPEEARTLPETYAVLIAYLRHERLEIRELAIRHLMFLAPGGVKKAAYNPSGTTEQRTRGYEEWKRYIPDGQIPPDQKARPEPKNGTPKPPKPMP